MNYIGRIPVRNLWLLMLYASELFRIQGRAVVACEQNPDDLPDLVAEILAHAVEVRLHRQLALGYRTRAAELTRLRGRVDLLTTTTQHLLARGRVACRFNELTIDTPRNRFVRAALARIADMVRRRNLAHQCRALAHSLKNLGVSAAAPSPSQMSREAVARHDSDERMMLAAAMLAFDLALPSETTGSQLLPAPEREEIWVRRLFEKAVGGLYKVALTPQGWRVKCGGQLGWDIAHKTQGIDALLPQMRTDIILEHRPSLRRIVIDTKFTHIVTSGWHREETLRSSHLYQIYAYLFSQIGRGDLLADRASGLLLHPAIGFDVDETVVIQGHAIRFATVDLAASAADVRARLLDLCA